jgi:hypothetical protein
MSHLLLGCAQSLTRPCLLPAAGPPEGDLAAQWAQLDSCLDLLACAPDDEVLAELLALQAELLHAMAANRRLQAQVAQRVVDSLPAQQAAAEQRAGWEQEIKAYILVRALLVPYWCGPARSSEQCSAVTCQLAACTSGAVPCWLSPHPEPSPRCPPPACSTPRSSSATSRGRRGSRRGASSRRRRWQPSPARRATPSRATSVAQGPRRALGTLAAAAAGRHRLSRTGAWVSGRPGPGRQCMAMLLTAMSGPKAWLRHHFDLVRAHCCDQEPVLEAAMSRCGCLASPALLLTLRPPPPPCCRRA